MQFSKEILKGAIDPVVLNILHKHGECYGYELVQLIREQTDGIFDLKEGTVYPLLYRLEDQKLISSSFKSTLTSKPRRYYEITKAGEKLLESKTNEYSSFIKAMKRALSLSLV
jgi:PadR family transcriptional regulator, regulatory protein PadR